MNQNNAVLTTDGADRRADAARPPGSADQAVCSVCGGSAAASAGELYGIVRLVEQLSSIEASAGADDTVTIISRMLVALEDSVSDSAMVVELSPVGAAKRSLPIRIEGDAARVRRGENTGNRGEPSGISPSVRLAIRSRSGVIGELCSFSSITLTTNDQILMQIVAGYLELLIRSDMRAEATKSRYKTLVRDQRRLVDKSRREARRHERGLLARELHDSVIQQVVSAGLHIELCEMSAVDSDTRQRLEAAKGMTAQVVDRIRSTIDQLTDDGSSGGELPSALERLCSSYAAGSLDVGLVITGEPRRLPAPADRSLISIASEALFNTMVHAGARRAAILLEYHVGVIELTIGDDGRGRPDKIREILEVSPASHGFAHRGLSNIHARVRELNGTLRFARHHLGGLEVHVEVPIR